MIQFDDEDPIYIDVDENKTSSSQEQVYHDEERQR
jgi:hypothetical protein